MAVPNGEVVALARLRGYQPLLDLLDGDPQRIDGSDEPKPPFPRVRATSTPNGDNRNLRHLYAPEILLEAWGDPDGRPGKVALHDILHAAVEALATLPDVEVQPGQPVVNHVVSSAGGGYSPTPTGNPRYVAAVRMYLHAPRAT